MMRIIAVLAILAIAGCQTGAQQQFSHMRAANQQAGAELRQCYATAAGNPSYIELWQHIAKPSDKPSLSQLADQSKPTETEKLAYVAYRADIDKCIAARNLALSPIEPTLVATDGKARVEADAVRVQLPQGRITWGEQNTQLASISAKMDQDIAAEQARVVGQLNARHQSELARRQAIAAAIAESSRQVQQDMQQQQLINAINRPVTTNCNRFGNSINCTSY